MLLEAAPPFALTQPLIGTSLAFQEAMLSYPLLDKLWNVFWKAVAVSH